MAMRLAVAVCVCLVSYAARAEGPDVRALLTPEEFHAAGLDKLSPEEIQALNRWLATYTARDAPDVRRTDPIVKAQVKKADAEGVKTRIAGEFAGWSGNTVFRLENGQVWRQRLPGQWFYRADSPEIELRKNALGFWTMTVLATNRSIGVTRVE